MKCIDCGDKTIVTDSRHTSSGIVIRRHKCVSCGSAFYTKEEYIDYEDIKEELNATRVELRKKVKNGKRIISNKI